MARALQLMTNRSAQDSLGPAGPSMEQLVLGSPIPFPVKEQYADGRSRGPFIGPPQIASLLRQAAPAYILPRNVVVKGVPGSSTEHWYSTVSVEGVLQAEGACKSVMHFPYRLQLTDEGSSLWRGGDTRSRASRTGRGQSTGATTLRWGGKGTPLCAQG